jgi:hypothetical protein
MMMPVVVVMMPVMMMMPGHDNDFRPQGHQKAEREGGEDHK